MIALLRETLAARVTVEGLASDLGKAEPDLPPDACRDLAGILRPFITSIPDALEWAVRASKDPRCGRAVAFGVGAVLHYLVDDDDLLPEDRFGALGLLDDALLVHRFTCALQEMWSLDVAAGALEPPDSRTVAVVETLLPDGIADALRRTADSLVRTAAALFAAPPDAARVIDLEDAVSPALRGAAAAELLEPSV